MTCVDVRDRLTELALGLLPPEEARELERHVDACAGCAKEWAELQEGVASVATSLPQADPPDELEDRVVDRVMASAGRGRHSARRRGGRVLLVAALAAAVLAGGALQWGIAQKHQVEKVSTLFDRAKAEQTSLADLVKTLKTEFRGAGQVYQADLFPGAAHQEAGTALIFVAPRNVGFLLVHVVAPLDEKRGPYTVQLVGVSGKAVAVGTLAKTNNGDWVLLQEDMPLNLSHSDSVELSQIGSLKVVDRFGIPVMNGAVHRFVESPPSP